MSSENRTVKVKIQRFNPARDKAPWVEEFAIPFEEGQSVLGVLKKIYEEQDPSLAFYNSCRIGKCAGCHVKINGKTELACTAIVKEGQDLLLEPIPGHPVIRDLVVDRTKAGQARRRS